MDSRILVFVVASIAISIENDDEEQLIKFGKYIENNTSTDAFRIAFNNLTVPLDRKFNKKAKGILYEYHDHLYSAALKVYTDGLLKDPVDWCMNNIPKDTNAKSPMEFCNENEPPALLVEQNYNGVIDLTQQYHQLPAHQNKPHTLNLNVPPAVSTPTTDSDEYPSYYGNITSTSTSNADEIDYLGFDLNQLPPEEYEENKK